MQVSDCQDPTSTAAIAPYAWIERALETLHRADWYRRVQTIAGLPGAVVELDGRRVINFASNDYLGLAGDARLIHAATEAVAAYGTGSTGSRLLSGHRALHRQLEQAIAQLKQTDDALVFSSGYAANLGAIAALVGPRDLILADQYNHSSLKNGARLSGATICEYPHGDCTALNQMLNQQRPQHRRCLVITDSVFSMDGDLAPLPAILALARQFDSMVLVDEAHATGVLGATGAGGVEHLGCTGQPLVQVGTLSKALGSLGGYVAGSALLIDWLRNRAPTWIYSTGLSPADTAAALTAVQIVQQEPARRQQLERNVAQLRQVLAPHFSLLPSESPILCAQCRTPAEALAIAQQLQQAGIFAPAIRPPTVPTSRLRFSVMATHEAAHCAQLAAVLTTIPN
ncbi:MAG: 8-amino-7-oxononanoate synthase [Spirulinaceae cyanobacterium SM2_1_0]|nr:8-amino-7-oxononanoate synthase [Spirulinaceae cyanobacterium SM2_1_0]